MRILVSDGMIQSVVMVTVNLEVHKEIVYHSIMVLRVNVDVDIMETTANTKSVDIIIIIIEIATNGCLNTNPLNLSK